MTKESIRSSRSISCQIYYLSMMMMMMMMMMMVVVVVVVMKITHQLKQ